ncbi:MULTISPECIES: hypothetical protein [unclassified Microbacterium]|uniref:hypothetical protein n=1 Tax=unclassified Microbacterium TaxID=2609290 RepID=UPI00214CEC57|nr:MULTISPECIES: hypothetical protein [unclassified Microbacterium]MCR2784178.1 hypothetical protein [Microbacterium sp. zg.B96]WIM14988.1 hypothetical protein QNO11_10540 [Microbacterium sp. zg-B96]
MSASSEDHTAWQRAKAPVIGTGAVAAIVIVAVGAAGWWSPRDVQDAASVELALVSRSTLHGFSFPIQHSPKRLTAVPASAVVVDSLLEPYRLTREEVLALSPIDATRVDAVSPDATQIARALSEVASREVNDAVDSFGYTVAVDFTVDGLTGEPLLLTWSLTGPDVGATWQTPRLGVRLEPTTDDDSGSADIWIPDLTSPGDYTVKVAIVRASDGSAVTSGDLHLPAADTPQE